MKAVPSPSALQTLTPSPCPSATAIRVPKPAEREVVQQSEEGHSWDKENERSSALICFYSGKQRKHGDLTQEQDCKCLNKSWPREWRLSPTPRAVFCIHALHLPACWKPVVGGMWVQRLLKMWLIYFSSKTQLSWRGTIIKPPSNFPHSERRKCYIKIKLKFNFWNFLGQNIILIRKLAYWKGEAVLAPWLTFRRRWEQSCWDKCPISGHGSAASLFCSPRRRFPGSKGQSR